MIWRLWGESRKGVSRTVQTLFRTEGNSLQQGFALCKRLFGALARRTRARPQRELNGTRLRARRELQAAFSSDSLFLAVFRLLTGNARVQFFAAFASFRCLLQFSPLLAVFFFSSFRPFLQSFFFLQFSPLLAVFFFCAVSPQFCAICCTCH